MNRRREVYALAGLVLSFGLGGAQCGFKTREIASQADLDAIAACPTLNGDIILSSSLTGDITISGVEFINGDLTCDNAPALTSVTFQDLKAIEYDLRFNNCASLTSLDFGALQNVEEIVLQDLPALTGLKMHNFKYIQTLAIGRTALKGFDYGLRENVTSSDIYLWDNIDLEDFLLWGIDNRLRNGLYISNSPKGIFKFWGLTHIGRVNVTNVAQVNLDLVTVGGSLVIENANTGVQSFSKLRSIGERIELLNTTAGGSTPGRNQIEFPWLSTVNQSITVYNNINMTSISAPKLQSLSSIDIAGNVSMLLFPSLASASIIFIRSSDQHFDCCDYVPLKNVTPHGEMWCASNVTFTNGPWMDYENGQDSWTDNMKPNGPGECDTKKDTCRDSTCLERQMERDAGAGSGIHLKGGKLVGTIVGSVMGAIVLGVVGWYIRRRKREQETKRAAPGVVHAAPTQAQIRPHQAMLGVGTNKTPQEIVTDYY